MHATKMSGLVSPESGIDINLLCGLLAANLPPGPGVLVHVFWHFSVVW